MHLPQLDTDATGNEHLQALVRRLHPDDVHSFVAKLTQPLPRRERFHVYRELLVGTELRDRGFDARYEMEIAGQTPDWSVANEGGNPIEIVDVLTLHQRHDKDLEICTTIRNAPLWVDWITVPADHIYRKLEYKAGQYSALARQTSLPYVLAVFGEFTASISPEEIRHVLLDQHGGWFTARPEVSGVLYFTKKPLEFFEFDYTYYGNPYAGHPSVLLSECPPGRL